MGDAVSTLGSLSRIRAPLRRAAAIASVHSYPGPPSSPPLWLQTQLRKWIKNVSTLEALASIENRQEFAHYELGARPIVEPVRRCSLTSATSLTCMRDSSSDLLPMASGPATLLKTGSHVQHIEKYVLTKQLVAHDGALAAADALLMAQQGQGCGFMPQWQPRSDHTGAECRLSDTNCCIWDNHREQRQHAGVMCEKHSPRASVEHRSSASLEPEQLAFREQQEHVRHLRQQHIAVRRQQHMQLQHVKAQLHLQDQQLQYPMAASHSAPRSERAWDNTKLLQGHPVVPTAPTPCAPPYHHTVAGLWPLPLLPCTDPCTSFGHSEPHARRVPSVNLEQAIAHRSMAPAPDYVLKELSIALHPNSPLSSTNNPL